MQNIDYNQILQDAVFIGYVSDHPYMEAIKAHISNDARPIIFSTDISKISLSSGDVDLLLQIENKGYNKVYLSVKPGVYEEIPSRKYTFINPINIPSSPFGTVQFYDENKNQINMGLTIMCAIVNTETRRQMAKRVVISKFVNLEYTNNFGGAFLLLSETPTRQFM